MLQRRGINFISQMDGESDVDFASRVGQMPKGRTVILAGLNDIVAEGSPFAGFTDKDGIFLAGVDTEGSGIDSLSYIQLVEMLKLALRIGLKDLLNQELLSENVSARPYGRYSNVFRLLPRTVRYDDADYERMRLIYEAQFFA
jgi:hypothetical protein